MADIINFADHYFATAFEGFDFTPALNYSRSTRSDKYRSDNYIPKVERQGSLDSLCGVYSIINAMSHVAKLSQKQRSGLFKQLIKSLNQYSSIAKCLRNGTNKKQLCFMLKIAQSYLAQKYNIRIRAAPLFKRFTRVNKKAYIAAIANFLGNEKNAIIVGVSGIHHHWTCITAVTPKTIKLLDSDGLSHFKIASCRISKNHSHTYHCLHPTGTWCVWLNK